MFLITLLVNKPEEAEIEFNKKENTFLKIHPTRRSADYEKFGPSYANNRSVTAHENVP